MEIIAGVDEVGRGPLAGPVVAAAVVLSENHSIVGLRDSKKLSKNKREELSKKIYKHANGIGIGIVDVKTIDKINIREATFKAMELAVNNLPIKPNLLLVDGHPLPNQVIPNKGIVGGDDLIDSIKAASIVAKVYRDSLMEKYSRIFPEYGFEKHNGYGTSYHMEALDNHRATPIHRRSFKPVKKRLPTFKWLSENNKIEWMGEKLSALYMVDKGLEILELNRDCQPYGKISMIAKDNQTLVFIIVHTFYRDRDYISLDREDYAKILDVILKLKRVYNEYGDHRIDEIKITLEKEIPIIKHFKGIDQQ